MGTQNPLDHDPGHFQIRLVRLIRKHQFKAETSPLAERFRPKDRQLELHPQEKWTLFWVTLHLCFLPWALGTMHLWSQCTSLALAIVGFIVAAQPRCYTEAQTGTEAVRVRPLQRLWRFPLFWIGLLVLVYIATQGINPAWRYRSNAAYWWIEPIKHLPWLPHGMDVEVPDDELAVVDGLRDGRGGGVGGVHAVGTGSVLAGRSATGRAVALTGGW